MNREAPEPKCSTRCNSQIEQIYVISAQTEKQSITHTPEIPLCPFLLAKDNHHPDSNRVDLVLSFFFFFFRFIYF